MFDNSVVPFLRETDEGFRGHAVEGNQGFSGFGMLDRVVVKICPKIFDPGKGMTWVVRAIAGVDGGDGSVGGLYTVGRESEDGEGRREHGV